MLATLSLLVAFSTTAEARPWRHHNNHVVVAPRGHVRLTIGAWAPGYVAPPRAGFRWVAGYYVNSLWYPGYYEPIAPPPEQGMVWVRGHWEGEQYIDGYWRRERADATWVEGHYNDDGAWVEGHWVDPRDARSYNDGPPPAPGVGQPPPAPLPPEQNMAQPIAMEETNPDEVHAPPPAR